MCISWVFCVLTTKKRHLLEDWEKCTFNRFPQLLQSLTVTTQNPCLGEKSEKKICTNCVRVFLCILLSIVCFLLKKFISIGTTIVFSRYSHLFFPLLKKDGVFPCFFSFSLFFFVLWTEKHNFLSPWSFFQTAKGHANCHFSVKHELRCCWPHPSNYLSSPFEGTIQWYMAWQWGGPLDFLSEWRVGDISMLSQNKMA